MADWLGWMEKFGIGATMGLIVCSFFFFILKWVLEQFKKELEENRKERKEYLDVLAGIKVDISEHNARAREFQSNVQAEHKEMIISLGRINGYKHD
jgi:predicted RND superfamily exporter protein